MRILIILLLNLVAASSLKGQSNESRGVSPISEGNTYVVAFPMVQAHPTEKPLPKPMMLLISSKVNATVRISSSRRDSAMPVIERTISLKANEVYKFDVAMVFMNGVDHAGKPVSQVVQEKGIRLTADHPISVMSYQAWMGNGDVARHLPIGSWGREYFTMNMYQDRYQGAVENKPEYRPSQIIIIAAHDSTDVTYTPRVTTEGSTSHPSVPAGTARTIRLHAGQTFIIKDKIDTSRYRDMRSDMSGTYITSTKPIGVLSGHVKVAVMRMPDVLPPTGMFSEPATMVRSNVHDAMLPISMSGTMFITLPLQYTPTRVVGQGSDYFGIDDDRGEAVRILATEDGTTVTSLLEDGSGFRQEARLQRGESFLATSVEVARLWKSDKPVLVGQYGKSYAKILPPVIRAKQGTELPQLFPTPESGMPMLQMVPPISRAATYGTYWAPEGMDNFMNIVFKTSEISEIKVDGRSLRAAFGGVMQVIKGTEYAYIITPIGAGSHVIESMDENVRWLAWTYGSLDGLQQGRAYGTPVGWDLSIPCTDTIVVTDQRACDVQASVAVSSDGGACSAIHSVFLHKQVNAELVIDSSFVEGLSTSTRYTVKFIDRARPGVASVTVVSTSGTWVKREYLYDPLALPPNLSVTQSYDETGPVHIDSSACASFRVQNLESTPVHLSNIRSANPEVKLTTSESRITLAGGSSVDITVCRDASGQVGTTSDTVLADVGCSTMELGVLISTFDRPTISCEDQTWTDIPSTSPGVEKPVEIRNAGDVPLTIRAIEGDTLDFATTNFGNVRGLDPLPIVIPAKSTYTWYVTYAPKGEANVQHRATVIISSDADGTDSLTTLTGRAVTTSVESDTPQAFSIAPNPTTGLLHLGSVDGVTSMQLVSQHGSVSDLPVHTTIDLGHMPTGVYTLRMVGRKSVRVARVMLTR